MKLHDITGNQPNLILLRRRAKVRKVVIMHPDEVRRTFGIYTTKRLPPITHHHHHHHCRRHYLHSRRGRAKICPTPTKPGLQRCVSNFVTVTFPTCQLCQTV
ncbi:protein hunchback [Trichinella spiralis]|uniref:protein hunchback n=1 Tax=Trichinella spiralis TaxID=6334 RepID=UPI0001EFD36F|nr:protein hunchback [Trichinella spiralis]